jgi:molybdopterin-guanine dinucleotide biosynthesis protein B
MRFDRVLIADWSAAAVPTSARGRSDAIWIGQAGGEEEHFRTRAAAESWLTTRLADGRRTLLGFDFAFGWPAGFAARLTGRADPRAVWAWLHTHLTDGPDNRNDRFALAAAINRRFHGSAGPFWSRPATLDLPDLPRRKREVNFAALGLAEHRVAEGQTRAKSVWMLSNPGAVGSQSLVGQPLLHRLVQAGAAVWPFDPPDVLARAQVVLAEVYPSLLAGPVAAESARLAHLSPDDRVKDRLQVRLLARALARLMARDRLAPLFAPPPAPALEEGWILGASHADLLAEAVGPDAG